jgi:hypothetical protein
MGSQSVTNFSAAKKKRIQERLRAFNPDATDAAHLAAEAGAEVIGSLAKFGGFSLTLTSASAQVAANTIADLIDGIKAERGGVLEAYGVDPSDPQPYAALVAGLRQKFNEDLSVSSRKTEAFPAAADALGATILEVIKDAFPRKREPSEVTRNELLQAIASAPEGIFSRVFTRSLLTSLVRESFDAARGKSPPELINALMNVLEPGINDLAIRLTRVGRK